MTEFFTILGIVWAVVTVLNWVLQSKLDKENLTNLKDELNERIRVVRLEELSDQGLYLAYDAENNQFLGQGTDIEETKTRILSRFPDRIFLLNGEPFTKMELNLPT